MAMLKDWRVGIILIDVLATSQKHTPLYLLVFDHSGHVIYFKSSEEQRHSYNKQCRILASAAVPATAAIPVPTS